MPFIGRTPDIGAVSDNSVTSAKIVNATIVEADLADDAVTAAKIANNAVDIARLNVSDGTNGQLLKTNGSGTLSFTDPPTGGASAGKAFFMGQI